MQQLRVSERSPSKIRCVLKRSWQSHKHMATRAKRKESKAPGSPLKLLKVGHQVCITSHALITRLTPSLTREWQTFVFPTFGISRINGFLFGFGMELENCPEIWITVNYHQGFMFFSITHFRRTQTECLSLKNVCHKKLLMYRRYCTHKSSNCDTSNGHVEKWNSAFKVGFGLISPETRASDWPKVKKEKCH